VTLQSRVSILGLGNMGAALARALLRRGHDVVVWNRTADRAAPIVAEGAVLSASPAAAIAASPVSIMCLIDHPAANAVLDSEGVAEALAGKTLAQLTSAVPEDVSDQAAWAKRCGARYLAGGIMVFPSSIGRPDASIVYAGDSSAFAEHRDLFNCLAGLSQYLGEDPRVAVGAYCSAGIYALGSIALFLETAALARHYGLSIETYYGLARASADLVLDRVRDGADRIATGRFDGDEATIDMVLSAMNGFCAAFAQTGIDARMTRAFTAHLQAASAAGNGEKDMASIAESLWTARGTAGSAAGTLRGHADSLCDSESGRVESEKELMLAADERFRQAIQHAEITARLTDAFTSQPQFIEPPGSDASPAGMAASSSPNKYGAV